TLVPLGRSEFGGGVPIVAGDVVDQHVEGTERGGRIVDGGAQRLDVGHIALPVPGGRQTPARQIIDELAGYPAGDIDKGYVGALAGEALDQACTNATAAAGDEHAATLEARKPRRALGKLRIRDHVRHV